MLRKPPSTRVPPEQKRALLRKTLTDVWTWSMSTGAAPRPSRKLGVPEAIPSRSRNEILYLSYELLERAFGRVVSGDRAYGVVEAVVAYGDEPSARVGQVFKPVPLVAGVSAA